ncbi:hypothetical protein Goshw_022470 [Gossypium schwendimanii]|uniref:Uncharacterized protein n=1 Tax=Gossypium schwendimanii TaxID=34291 RepID=A0A7J9KMQ5_GOSSC|nr:hypothetical protein [Gossypium schwendimanii]
MLILSSLLLVGNRFVSNGKIFLQGDSWKELN